MVLVATGLARLVSSGAVDVDVVRFCGLGLGALLVRAASGVVAAHGQARLSSDVGAELRLRVLGGWLRCNPLLRSRQTDHGHANEVGVFGLTEGVHVLEQGFSVGLIGTLRSTLQIVPLVVLLVVLEARLAVLAVIAMGTFALLLRGIRRQLSRAQRNALDGSEALVLAADEAIEHADVWRVFGAEKKASERIAAIGKEMGKRASRVAALGAASSGLNEVLAGIVLVALVALARAGMLGDVRIDRLLPFVVTFFLAYKPLRDLAESQLALSRARAAWTKLAPIVHAEGEASEGRTFDLAPLDIDVVLARGNAGHVHERIAPGSIVVVRGPIGIGKTTLFRVLLGLERAERGEVRYAGRLLDAPAGRARPFAWVPQESPILADTLEANVQLASEDADVRAIMDLLGGERVHADVRDARIGPKEISGGERQIVSIARALATDRPVLLMDEPTSGLDARAQAIVLSAIASLRGTRSVIIATHRPEPIAIADRVIDLEGSPRESRSQPRSKHAALG